MKSKKFIAPTMREALQQIKNEFGDGAIILKSEKVTKGGVFDLLKKEMIEVIATAEEEAIKEITTGPDFAQHLDSSLTQPKSAESERRMQYELEMLKDEVRGLRQNLTDVSTHLKYSKMPALPRELSKAYTRLEESGLEKRWVQDLIGQALVELAADELVSSPNIDRFLMAQVSGVFSTPAPARRQSRNLLSIGLVGPAGSGKTTTLIKLATHSEIFGKRQVGIITMDTRRLAAIEQIRTFSRISGIPLEVIYKPEQVSAARRRLQGMDVILVDTSGCNPRNEKGLQELHDMVDQADCNEVHLVLSATTRDRELNLICDKYRAIPYSHLIFTHADEAIQYGSMANVVRRVAKPVHYIGSGPSIPEDIRKLKPQQIAEWILHPEQTLGGEENLPA